MRGVHSAVDDIRRSVFTEVARLAYSGDDYTGVDMIPYKIVSGAGGGVLQSPAGSGHGFESGRSV